MFCLFGTWGLEGLAIGDPAVAPQTLNNLFTIRLLPDATATPTRPGWRPRRR
jgi:hypothetical protein